MLFDVQIKSNYLFSARIFVLFRDEFKIRRRGLFIFAFSFRIHDTNNDNRLDGLEIYNAILHIVRPKEWNNYEKISQQTEDDIARK